VAFSTELEITSVLLYFCSNLVSYNPSVDLPNMEAVRDASASRAFWEHRFDEDEEYQVRIVVISVFLKSQIEQERLKQYS
jgi:hypothetical protein